VIQNSARKFGDCISTVVGKPLDLDTFARATSNLFRCKQSEVALVASVPPRLATQPASLGVDDKTIQTILRHSSVHTTREIYIRAWTETQLPR